MSVKVPEAVVLREELHAAAVVAAAVVVVESSFLAHDPISATMPMINANKKNTFFILPL
jgi:hypothetical protein